MADAIIINDAYISIDGDDVSEYCNKVTIHLEAEKIPTDAFGNNGAKQKKQGLRDNTFTVTFQADEDGVIDDLLWRLYDLNEEFTVVVGRDGSTPTTVSPHYTSTRCHLFNYDPINAEVGNKSETDVTIESNENIIRLFT